MTERELLELAAKAAGIELDFSVRGDNPPYYVNERGGHSSFNPLTDDGDALRLAVKLGMEVWQSATDSAAIADLLEKPSREPHEADPYAATRRAIVRAAAEIGRGHE